jgi:hypothetical protein
MRKLWTLVLFATLATLVLGSLALAETRIEKNLTLEPKGRFVLDSDMGSVTVTGTSKPGAHVVITSNREDLDKLFDLRFEGEPGTARVTARRRFNFGWSKNISLHFEVEVPSETSTTIRTGGGSVKEFGLRGDSDLKTSGGSIEASGLKGHLDAETSGGSIHLREVTGDARVDTSGGSIEVAALEGSLRAHTSGGPIHIDRVSGYVEAKTSGGSIGVNFDHGNTHGGILETSGGSIDVRLDPSANLNIDAATSGGSVRCDLPVRVVGTIKSSSLEGKVGSGGEMLRLRTSGGSIRIGAL